MITKTNDKLICHEQPFFTNRRPIIIWDKVFKNGPSEISSTNFTWSILEYFVPFLNTWSILEYFVPFVQNKFCRKVPLQMFDRLQYTILIFIVNFEPLACQSSVFSINVDM